jgi:hypothetical protein
MNDSSPELNKLPIIEDKYLPPQTMYLITRAQQPDESFEEWVKRAVCVVTNVRMPNRPPWNGK